ncbi:MAG: HAD-IC family P-type ATPase [Nitrososphaerales archaeon]|nr:HAD-IC family P-type ATPase [Nitrososphaerales archaeon]
MGASGTVGGANVKVGRRDYAGVPSPWEFDEQISGLLAQGNTVVFVSAGGEKGAIAVGDAVKADAEEAVKAFGELGISLLMLTGDDEETALAVASRVGISQVRARLLPGEKESVVAELQRQGRKVAMVGDGVNDAPALANADLGIAIGSGTDVAKETGGVVLIGNRLTGAVGAIRVGRATLAKIKQNLLWAFGYNALLIPVAAGALIPFYGVGIYSFLPFLAGVAMASSSASVVAN